MNDFEFYEKIKNWDFSMINYIEESLTNWNMVEEIIKHSTKETKILDLGTAGGERVLKDYPKVKEILGTDFSSEMIKTANKNLLKTDKDYIKFRVMDNLKMDVEENYYDIITARHTIIDPKGVLNALKEDGVLILRGVDKLDCWDLKRRFGKGQAYHDIRPVSLIDYENLLNAGFKHVELIPIHTREYFKTKEDLLALLLKTPILADCSEENQTGDLTVTIDENILNDYIKDYSTDKGILLIRRYYGIIAYK